MLEYFEASQNADTVSSFARSKLFFHAPSSWVWAGFVRPEPDPFRDPNQRSKDLSETDPKTTFPRQNWCGPTAKLRFMDTDQPWVLWLPQGARPRPRPASLPHGWLSSRGAAAQQLHVTLPIWKKPQICVKFPVVSQLLPEPGCLCHVYGDSGGERGRTDSWQQKFLQPLGSNLLFLTSKPFEWKFENGEAFGFIFLPSSHDCSESGASQTLSLRDLFLGRLFGGIRRNLFEISQQARCLFLWTETSSIQEWSVRLN